MLVLRRALPSTSAVVIVITLVGDGSGSVDDLHSHDLKKKKGEVNELGFSDVTS